MSAPPRICALDSTIRRSIRAHQVITGIAVTIEELVCNSIDAGASKIEIRADIQGLQFSVADNGCGMDESDLALAGLHFHTSKINTAVSASRLATYGFRGEALASIAECSSIEIISRTQQSTVQWKKVLLGGSELYCGPLTSNELRSSHGTAVNVSKFFYNLPLRRQAISANCSAELENVKCRLQRIALIHPNIQFSLIDSHSKSSIMQCQRTESIRSRFSSIFDSKLAQSLIKLPYLESLGISIDGLVCPFEATHSSNALQFVFVNGRSVISSLVSSLVSKIYVSASKACVVDSCSGGTGSPVPHKRVKRHPYFLIRIQCSDVSCFDFLNESGKTATMAQLEFSDDVSANILSLIASAFMAAVTAQTIPTFVVDQVLIALNALFSELRIKTLDISINPCKSSQGFVDHSRAQVSTSVSIQLDDHLNSHLSNATLPDNRISRSSKVEDLSAVRIFQHEISSPFSSSDSEAPPSQVMGSAPVDVEVNPELVIADEDADDCLATWLFSQQLTSSQTATADSNESHSVVRTCPSKPLPDCFARLRSRPATEADFRPAPHFSSNLSNKKRKQGISSIQAQSSLTLSNNSETDSVSVQTLYSKFRDRDVQIRLPFSLLDSTINNSNIPTQSVSLEIDREMLQSLQVFSQIHRKFLVCHTNDCVVLIDQHAADERVRLEMLEREVFGDDRLQMNVGAQTIIPPHEFDITPHEAFLLRTFDVPLRLWSFCVNVNESGTHAVLLEAPRLYDITLSHFDCLEYCNLLEKSGSQTSQAPPAVTRVLHLRACRGAIKFGDKLSVVQCRDLLDALRQTNLPFQCAHGRPSMAPVIRIPEGMMQAAKSKLFEQRITSVTSLLQCTSAGNESM